MPTIEINKLVNDCEFIIDEYEDYLENWFWNHFNNKNNSKIDSLTVSLSYLFLLNQIPKTATTMNYP